MHLNYITCARSRISILKSRNEIQVFEPEYVLSCSIRDSLSKAGLGSRQRLWKWEPGSCHELFLELKKNCCVLTQNKNMVMHMYMYLKYISVVLWLLNLRTLHGMRGEKRKFLGSRLRPLEGESHRWVHHYNLCILICRKFRYHKLEHVFQGHPVTVTGALFFSSHCCPSYAQQSGKPFLVE